MSKYKPPKIYEQKFRKEWVQDILLKDWIAAILGDDFKAFCKFCKCDIKAKYQDLKQHKQTKKHISACPFKNRTLDSFVKIECNKTSQLVGNIALFFCYHSAISNCNYLVDMFKNKVCDSKIVTNMKMHRTKYTNIFKNTLCGHFEADLLKDIGKNKSSLLIDKSDNIIALKLLGISIIYYSNIRKRLYQLILGWLRLKNAILSTSFWQLKT